jgi:hypothetical protein
MARDSFCWASILASWTCVQASGTLQEAFSSTLCFSSLSQGLYSHWRWVPFLNSRKAESICWTLRLWKTVKSWQVLIASNNMNGIWMVEQDITVKLGYMGAVRTWVSFLAQLVNHNSRTMWGDKRVKCLFFHFLISTLDTPILTPLEFL